MINSRELNELHPRVKAMSELWLGKLSQLNIDVIITSTYRDHESQAALYAQGRTAPGRIVTHAKPGQSMHQYRVALDFVPTRNGKLVWGTKGADLAIWTTCGILAEAVGFVWAARWKRFREFPHIQFTNGLTLADFQAGKTIKDSVR